MNIWKWLEETQETLEKTGHERLAMLIDEVPALVTDDQHAQVDAVVPEAIALAQQVRLPWLEVYFRHWWMQSRVSNRNEGLVALGDAVRSLEFAHRPENRDCPQSVCCVHDLSICYGVIDGPGFVEERKKVVEETLARLEPSTACFDCISSEYASVLRYEKKYEEGLAFVDQQVKLRKKAGASDDSRNLESSKINHLIGLGRYKEALALVDRLQKTGQDERDRWISLQLDRAEILVCMGQHEEAKKALPTWGDIAETGGFYPSWADTVYELVQAGIYTNNWELVRTFSVMLETLGKQGAVRDALEIAEIQAKLALARGGLFVAQRAIERMEAWLPQLHKPLDAPDKIRQLKTQWEQAAQQRHVALPETPALLLQSVGEDPEKDWILIEAALVRWPQDPGLVMQGANALRAMGADDVAEKTLRDHLRNLPTAEDVAVLLGNLLLGKKDPHDLLAFCDECSRNESGKMRAVGSFFRALWLQREKKWADSNEAMEHVLRENPESHSARMIFAENAIELKQWDLALDKLNEAVALGMEPGGVDWARILAATIVGRWDIVRDACARLQVPLSSTEGPIHEEWEWCRIQFGVEEGAPAYYAQRTGPVTARIVHIAHPDRPQHYGDEVVFSARPLNEGPAEGEEQGHSYLYAHVHTLRPGNMISFDIDGVHPGSDLVEKIEALATGLGGAFQVRSNEQYVVHGPDEEELSGLYAFFCVPEATDLHSLYRSLEAILAAAPHSMALIRLAARLGNPAEEKRQEERMDRYGLILE